MSDLVEFLRAQLDEDQRVAAAATPGEWRWKLEGPGRHLVAIERDIEHVVITSSEDPLWGLKIGNPTAAFLVANQPRAVFAEIDAKRAIVKLHDSCGSGSGYCDDGGHGGAGEHGDQRGCSTLELLALPYAGRDGWDPDWATS